MIKSIVNNRALKLVMFAMILVSFMVIHSSKKVEAATPFRTCGINPNNNQGTHDFAGAIINTKWTDDDGDLRTSYRNSAGDPLRVNLAPVEGGGYPYNDPSYGRNKIVKLDPGTNARVDSRYSGNFNTVDGCSLVWATVFGKTFINPNGLSSKSSLLIDTISNNWVLDCDASHWGVGNEQRFTASVPVGQVPEGARSGGSWTSVTFRAINGSTANVDLIYTQPSVSTYEIRSNLVNNTNFSLNMPDSGSNVSYGSGGNGQHRIKVNDIDRISNQTHYVSINDAQRSLSSSVLAPGTIRIRNNSSSPWQDWTRVGYSTCRNENKCRTVGPQVTGSEANFPANTIRNGALVKVYWYYEPPGSTVTSCSLFANDESSTTIDLGDSFTLGWNSRNADSFSINQGIGSKTPNQRGSQTVTPTSGGTFTYTGTARKSGINYTCSATVTVVAPPPTCYLTAYNSSGSNNLSPGEQFTLYWTSENASSFIIDQGIGSKTPNQSGSQSLTAPLSGTRTYTGTGTAPGQANANCTTTITVVSPPTCTLSITSPVSGSGSVDVPSGTTSATLSWTLGADTSYITFIQGRMGTFSSNASGSTLLTNPNTIFTATPYNSTNQPGPVNCQVIVNVAPDQPYLKVYGNDVAAGNGVGTGCSVTPASTTATIDANAKSINPGIGAGTQFAAYAPGTIKGFLSAVTRQGAPFAPPNSANGLTFGNSTDGINLLAPTIAEIGGKSATTRCMPDYVGMARTSANVNAGAGDGKVINYTNNTIPATTNIAGRNTVFKQGDLTISGDLKYNSGNYNWGSINDIPSLVIVVDGDVFINSNVQTIDPIIIARGTIYTCTNGASNSMPSNGTCNTKLTINGAFMASTVKFWRTNGKVADSMQNENSGSTNIAEVFNFSPETYVAPMPDLFKRTSAFTKYDYVTSLPPTL